MLDFLRRRAKASTVACDTGVLANMIVIMAEEIAPHFVRGQKSARQDVTPEIELELCALYLHLFDRDAFLESGGEARNRFADSLFDAFSERIEQRSGIAPADLADFCNERQIEYSGYKELIAPPGASVAGTLFWEFGKKLGFAYQGYNPVALQLFVLRVADGYISLREVVTEGKVRR